MLAEIVVENVTRELHPEVLVSWSPCSVTQRFWPTPGRLISSPKPTSRLNYGGNKLLRILISRSA